MDYIIMENGKKILLETQQKVTIQRTVLCEPSTFTNSTAKNWD